MPVSLTPTKPPSGSLPDGLTCIRTRESQASYTVVSRYGDHGAYQYKNDTWNGYGGYDQANLAPPAVQDARALADYLLGPVVRHKLWPNTSKACGV